jgi:hypothetical protein
LYCSADIIEDAYELDRFGGIVIEGARYVTPLPAYVRLEALDVLSDDLVDCDVVWKEGAGAFIGRLLLVGGG